MGKRQVFYKNTNCECGDPFGCEDCTCHDCGNFLESSEDSVCCSCLDKFEAEHECN